jgi:hypothetical protein
MFTFTNKEKQDLLNQIKQLKLELERNKIEQD